MVKRRLPKPQIRKSVYVFGAAAVGVALVGMLLVTLVGGGGGGGGEVAAPSPAPGVTRPDTSRPNGPAAEPVALREGGTDPFRPLVAAQAGGSSAPEPAPEPEPEPEPASQAILLEVVAVDNGVANIRVDSNLHEGVKAGAQLSSGFVLEAIEGECAFIARSPERFRVCEGERFLK